MSLNFCTFLYVYLTSFMLVFRFDAVFSSVNIPETCVGDSCKDLSNDYDDRHEAQKRVQSQQESAEHERRNAGRRSSLEMEKRPGSDGMEGGEEDLEMFSDDDGSYQQTEPSGSTMHEIRIKEQQKAVEEARRNFLNRRTGSTHGSDDEVEELNRLLENSSPPPADTLSVLSKPSEVSASPKANGVFRDSESPRVHAGNQETHDFQDGNEISVEFDGGEKSQEGNLFTGEDQAEHTGHKDEGDSVDDEGDDGYEGHWEDDDDEFFEEENGTEDDEDGGGEGDDEFEDETGEGDGHHIKRDDIESIDPEVNIIQSEDEEYNSASLSDDWRTSAQMEMDKASFASDGKYPISDGLDIAVDDKLTDSLTSEELNDLVDRNDDNDDDQWPKSSLSSTGRVTPHDGHREIYDESNIETFTERDKLLKHQFAHDDFEYPTDEKLRDSTIFDVGGSRDGKTIAQMDIENSKDRFDGKPNYFVDDDDEEPGEQNLEEASKVRRPKANSLLAGMIRRGSEAVKREKDGSKTDPVGKDESPSEDFDGSREWEKDGVYEDGTPLTRSKEHSHSSELPVTMSGSVQKADATVDERREMRNSGPTAVPPHRPPLQHDSERPHIQTPERSKTPPLDETKIPRHERNSMSPEDRQSMPPERQQVPPSDRMQMPPSERPRMPPSERPLMPPSDRPLERQPVPSSVRQKVPPNERQQMPPYERQKVPPNERQEMPPYERQKVPPNERQEMPPSERQHMHHERQPIPPSEMRQMPPSDRYEMPPSERQHVHHERQPMPPSQKQGTHPSERQHMHHERQPMPPSETQQMPPSERQQMPPSERQQMPPSERQPMPPSERQQMPPSERQQMPPSERQQMPPSERQPMPPSERQPMPPSERQPMPPSERQQMPPSERQPMPPSERQQMPPSERQPMPPSERQQMPPSERQQMPPSERQQMPPRAVNSNQPPSDGPPMPPSEKSHMPPSERAPIPSKKSQLPPSERPPMPPLDRQPMSHSQRSQLPHSEAPSTPPLSAVEKGMPPERPPLAGAHVAPPTPAERHVPSSFDRNPIPDSSEKLSVPAGSKRTASPAASSTASVPDGTFTARNERKSPEPSSHDSRMRNRDMNTGRENEKMVQHESQHAHEMDENHRKEKDAGDRLEREHDSLEKDVRRDSLDRDDLGSRYIREGDLEREGFRRMEHPNEKQPPVDDDRFSNVMYKADIKAAEIDRNEISSEDDDFERSNFGKRKNISEHGDAHVEVDRRSKDSEYEPVVAHFSHPGKDAKQVEDNNKFKEKENYQFRKSDVGEHESGELPRKSFTGKDSRFDDGRDFEDLEDYDAEKKNPDGENVKKGFRDHVQRGNEEMESDERASQRFEGVNEEEKLAEDEYVPERDDEEMTENYNDDEDEFHEDEEGARDDEHSEMDEGEVDWDEESNFEFNDTEIDDHDGNKDRESVDPYEDSDAEFRSEVETTKDFDIDEREKWVSRSDGEAEEEFKEEQTVEDFDGDLDSGRDYDSDRRQSSSSDRDEPFSEGFERVEVEETDNRVRHDAVENDSIDATADSDLGDGAYLNEVDDFKRHPDDSVSEDLDPKRDTDGVSSEETEENDDFRRESFRHSSSSEERFADSSDSDAERSGPELSVSDSIVSHADDTSFISNIFVTCDLWSGTLLAMLPSTLQALFAYSPFPLSPARTFALFLISSVTFFAIRLTVYCRKPHRSDEKVNAAEVSTLQKKLNALQQERDSFQKQVNGLQVQVKDLQSRSNAEIKDSSSQLHQVMKERDGLKQKVTLLSSQIQQLSATIDAQNQALGVEHEQNLSYQQVNAQLSAHIAYLDTQMSDLTHRCSFAQSSASEMQSQVQCMTEEVSVLQVTKDELQLELDEWKEMVQNMSKKMNRMRQEETHYKEKLMQKEQEIQAMQEFFAQLLPEELRQDRDGEASGMREAEIERAKESLQDMLESVVEISEIRKKLKDLEQERDSLKSLTSSEFENRSKLEVEVKQLKEIVDQKTRNLEMAERKTEDLEVLTNFFREKESDLNQKLSMQRERSCSKNTYQLDDVDERTRDLELTLHHYKERAENFEKEMHKAEAEHRKQLAAQEKKAHENWLLARQCEREAKDFKNEASALKFKIVELQNQVEDMSADKMDTDSMKDSSSLLPEMVLGRPPLHPPMLPGMIPPRFDSIFPPDLPPFYVPPMVKLPFPPHLFDIPHSHNNPYFDETYAHNHRRSLPFNVRRPSRQEHGSPELARPSYRRSPSAPDPYSPESSTSLDISPAMTTGQVSPHAGIMSPPKIIDRPGAGGPRPLPIRPQRSFELKESSLE